MSFGVMTDMVICSLGL